MKSGFAAICYLSLMTLSGYAIDVSSDCLFSSTPNVPRPQKCSVDDPLSLAQERNIQEVISAFGLTTVHIKFKGCEFAEFATGPTAATQTFVITYPLIENRSEATYLAPITHELAHVFQIVNAGSYASLRQISIKRIELGADFLTGVIFANFLKNVDINKFQHNLNLIGLYNDIPETAHGTPEERIGAFRRGVHLPFENFSRQFRNVNKEFQDNVFGEITSF